MYIYNIYRPCMITIHIFAGSERGGRTGVSSMGARQKEASNINTSLMKLWRCLNQMRRSKVMQQFFEKILESHMIVS